MTFNARKEWKESTLNIYIEGVLDISTVNLLQDYLSDIDGIKELYIHLDKLEFIDSTGVGTILDWIYQASSDGFSIKLVGLNDITKEIFETLGVFKILEALQMEGIQ